MRRLNGAARTLVVFLFLVLAGAGETQAQEPGDANCDGEIKLDDLWALTEAVFEVPDPIECDGLDVNDDGAIGAADVVAILQPVVDNATRSIAIFVLGDGMGPEHVRAGAALAGAPLGFTDFPVFVPGIDTSSLDTLQRGEVTDSAAGATAFATGVRVRNGEISQTGGMRLRTAGELAAGAGKAVGIVTNSYLFDASPAAFISHSPSRDFLPLIADQYLALAPDVLMGGAPRAAVFPQVEDFVRRARARGYTVVRTAEELEAVDPGSVDRLLALFDVDYDLGLGPLARVIFTIFGTPRVLRTPDAIDPPLARMAEVATAILAHKPFGFFLFVENENIDTMSHAGGFNEVSPNPIGLLVAGEVVELAETTDRIVSVLSETGREGDALVLVTADHETGGFTFDQDPAGGSFPDAPLHTAAPVPLYARGAGAERFAAVVDNVDVFTALRPSLR
jgi:alkaline phosphatase